MTEYWVVDPDIDVIRIYRLDDDRFGRAIELSGEARDTLTTAALPGFGLSLARVFAD